MSCGSFWSGCAVRNAEFSILEFFAYWVNVSPVKVYTPEEFIDIILKQFEMPIKLNANYSVQEQIEDFIETHNVFTDYYQVLQIYQQKDR